VKGVVEGSSADESGQVEAGDVLVQASPVPKYPTSDILLSPDILLSSNILLGTKILPAAP